MRLSIDAERCYECIDERREQGLRTDSYHLALALNWPQLRVSLALVELTHADEIYPLGPLS